MKPTYDIKGYQSEYSGKGMKAREQLQKYLAVAPRPAQPPKRSPKRSTANKG